MVINNVHDLAEYFGTTPEHLKKAIYKGTDCGAWIEWDNGGFRIGSIVEGSDAEFSEEFEYPCSSAIVDDWLEELEELTDEAWHEANDDDFELEE